MPKDFAEQTEFPSMIPPSRPPLEVSYLPKPSRKEPAIWVRHLSVWSAWPPSPTTQLRVVTLRRGLNILWAESRDDTPETRIGGHGAGKTTFCRLLRFVLGERQPGPAEFRQDFRQLYDDGWVLGEVVVEGELWLVGKTLGERGQHHFALRGADQTTAFGERPPEGGYDEYQEALDRAALGRLPIRTLSGSGRPVKWVHLLAWLARDQEAHYANLLAWRDTASEPEGQDLSAPDRENLVRLVLGLLTEQTEQERISSRNAATVEHETKVKSRSRQEFFRERARNALGAKLERSLDEILGGEKANVPNDPLLVSEVEMRAKAKDEEAAAAIRAAHIDEDLQEAEARVIVAAARTISTRVNRALVLKRLNELKPATVGDQVPAVEPGYAEMYAQAAAIEKIVGEIRGLCNRTKDEAETGKCPLFQAPSADEETRRAIAKQEERDDAAAAQTRSEISRLEKLLTEHTRMVVDAEGAEQNERVEFAKTKAFLEQERARIGGAAEEAKEVRAALTAYRTTCQEWDTLEREVGVWQGKKDSLDEEIAKLAEDHREIVGDFALLFEDLAKELLGKNIEASVRLGKGIVPALQYAKHRRKSAALNLATLLAFDLASLALGMTCERAHHPRFLIHDSPRESDLALSIYHALFRTARKVERACEGEPAFQYILTTTEAPPADMNCAPWRLEPVLDASDPTKRFLGVDLG